MFTTRYEVNTSSELLEFYRLVNECKRSSDWKSNAARNWNLVWRVSGSELLALWKGRKPRSPSPRPSPRGRGKYQARLSPIGRTRKLVARPPWLPLLWGEGWGGGGNRAAGLSLPPKTSLARGKRASIRSGRGQECRRSNYPGWWFGKNLRCAPSRTVTVQVWGRPPVCQFTESLTPWAC